MGSVMLTFATSGFSCIDANKEMISVAKGGLFSGSVAERFG